MTASWTSDELTRIGRAEELEIASVRRDGALSSPGRSGSSGSATRSTSAP